MNRCFLTGAYGKKYTSNQEIETDWNEGKDFRVYQGPYCSIRDKLKLKISGFTHICVVWQDFDNGNRVMNYDLEI